MNGMPALRLCWASWISVVVFPRPAGPFENDAAALRERLVDLLDRQLLGGLRTIRVKPHGCQSDERILFRPASPISSDDVGSPPRSVDELCEVRFGLNIKVEVVGAERGVLRQRHLRDDLFTPEDVKFDVVVLQNLLCPLSSGGVADLARGYEEQHLQGRIVFLGGLRVCGNLLQRCCDRGGEPLPDPLQRQLWRCVGIEAENRSSSRSQ